ncbi:hypothetical protein TCAL_16717 [Tigriopus californicus]|uniref:Uncharacterized protein n=1 Tax=Tigriopus californicus TaxID=6832 RepID=A0A553PLU9_TIGCA|nr:hypothetical protein TCAL_16717 [Tigriopus californicus]
MGGKFEPNIPHSEMKALDVCKPLETLVQRPTSKEARNKALEQMIRYSWNKSVEKEEPLRTCDKCGREDFELLILDFWVKEVWPPYSPDANLHDHVIGPHIQSKACRVQQPNLRAIKASVDEHWAVMSEDYVKKTCLAFRKRLKVIIAAGVGYIE